LRYDDCKNGAGKLCYAAPFGLKENFEYIEKKNHSLEEKATNIKSNKIFIVHGRNEAAKLSVESFLKDLGLEPIILHKQANQGQTIIEKIEAHSDVAFAVVLLTPDDDFSLLQSSVFQ